MKVTAPINLSNVNSIDELKRFVGIFCSNVTDILNGNVLISDNVASKLLTFTFTSSNKTVGMDHGLGVIPTGYFQVGSDVSVNLFDGDQKNTISTIYLRSSGSAVVRVLVFA